MTPEQAKEIDAKLFKAAQLRDEAANIEHRLLEDNGWRFTSSGTPGSQWMYCKKSSSPIRITEGIGRDMTITEIQPHLLVGKSDALRVLTEEVEMSLPEEEDPGG